MEDGATATKLFQDLLNACQRESTPFELRKSFCEWMGEIIGGLDFPEAQSPIELELLAKAKKSDIRIAIVAYLFAGVLWVLRKLMENPSSRTIDPTSVTKRSAVSSGRRQ